MCPRAQVLPSDGNVINHRGNRHRLLIPGVSEESFGEYTCEAANQYGKASKTTTVSGN